MFIERRKFRPIPPRVMARPEPSQWQETELMSLPEAAALFWPDGLLSVANLRKLVASRRLAHVRLTRKVLTSKASIIRMSECALDPVDSCASEPPAPVTPCLDERERLRKTILGRKRRSTY
jgi:hypothetical protein